MKNNNAKMLSGKLAPSIVYIVGETDVLVHLRTPELQEAIEEFVQSAPASQVDAQAVGLMLDKRNPDFAAVTGGRSLEVNHRMMAAGAEVFLRRSPGAAEAAKLGRNSLIAVAFRLRNGGYAVRTIMAFDCDGITPIDLVLASVAGTLSDPVAREKFEAVGIAPDSHYHRLVPPVPSPAARTVSQSGAAVPVSANSGLRSSLAFESQEALMTVHSSPEELKAKLAVVESCTLVHWAGGCAVEFRGAAGKVCFVEIVPRSAISEKNARSASRAKSLRCVPNGAECDLPPIRIAGSAWSYSGAPSDRPDPAQADQSQAGERPRTLELYDFSTGPTRIHNDGQLIRGTNYFDSSQARAGAIGVSCNAGAVRLLIPPSLECEIPDMLRGTTHVEVSILPASRIKSRQTCSVWLFEDHSDRPYFMELSAGNFLDLLPDADFEGPLTIWKKGLSGPELVATLGVRWTRVNHLKRRLTR